MNKRQAITHPLLAEFQGLVNEAEVIRQPLDHNAMTKRSFALFEELSEDFVIFAAFGRSMRAADNFTLPKDYINTTIFETTHGATFEIAAGLDLEMTCPPVFEPGRGLYHLKCASALMGFTAVRPNYARAPQLSIAHDTTKL